MFENIFKFLLTFEAALHGGGRVDPLLELVAGEDAVDDDEDTRHAGRDQGAHRDGPEVLDTEIIRYLGTDADARIPWVSPSR